MSRTLPWLSRRSPLTRDSYNADSVTFMLPVQSPGRKGRYCKLAAFESVRRHWRGAMAWIGKVTGGLLGYAAARLFGAVVGVILGHQFDRGMTGPAPGREARRAAPGERQRVFFETTFLVMGHLAKVDGRVSEAEIGAARAVMQRMRLDERQTRLAMALFNAGKQAGFPVEQQVERLGRYCAGQPELLRTFLEIQLDLALVKGAVSPAERDLLGRVADRLRISRLALVQLEALMRARRAAGPDPAQARQAALEDAYAVLGVARTASDREVKTAYRRLMNQHHPDKQAARGLPESMLEMAKERTREILAAYESIKAERGLK